MKLWAGWFVKETFLSLLASLDEDKDEERRDPTNDYPTI